MLLVSACAHRPVDLGKSTSEIYLREFRKICLTASGKGRIELLTAKHIFSFESILDRHKNKFELALDFPIHGEKLLSLNLDPAMVNQDIKNSQITELLKNQIGSRQDQAAIAKSVEQFFVFSADFLQFRANNTFPTHYSAKLSDGHFLMERSTPLYRFVIDNFESNENFYERTVFKIFTKEHSTTPVVTLYLVPQACE